MDQVLKIGIIGCGAIGKDHCRRINETVPGATVVAVSDYVAAAADETAAKYGIRSFGNDCDGSSDCSLCGRLCDHQGIAQEERK